MAQMGDDRLKGVHVSAAAMLGEEKRDLEL